jgi:hypothetical protein
MPYRQAESISPCGSGSTDGHNHAAVSPGLYIGIHADFFSGFRFRWAKHIDDRTQHNSDSGRYGADNQKVLPSL